MLDRRVEILKTLRATPVVLRALVEGVEDARLRRRPAPGEWAIIEVMGHLADTEERALVRVRRMLAEDDPSCRRLIRRRWLSSATTLGWTLPASWPAWRSSAASTSASGRPRCGGLGADRPAWAARLDVGGAVRDPRGCRRGRPPGPDRQAAVGPAETARPRRRARRGCYLPRVLRSIYVDSDGYFSRACCPTR
jgi:DinB family protein